MAMMLWGLYKGMAMQKFSNGNCITDVDTCSELEQSIVRTWNMYGFHMCLFSHALNAAILFRLKWSKSKEIPSWFFALLTITFTAFSGGTLGPVSISSGQFPFIVRNDSIFLFCVLTWALTSSPAVVRWLSQTPVRLVWTNLAMINRSHTICEMVNATTRIIAASKVGSPDGDTFHFWGPVMVAVIVSCAGLFFPLSTGFAPLLGQFPAPVASAKQVAAEAAPVPPPGSGTPFVIQGAFLTAAAYHAYTHDTSGWLGNALRTAVHWLLVVVFGCPVPKVPGGVLPPLLLSDRELRLCIVLFWHVMMTTQLLTGGYNPLSPLYDRLYWLSGVQGPMPALPQGQPNSGLSSSPKQS